MKVAVIGPAVKDVITIDGEKKIQMGGIPYYTCNALHNLGVEVTPYVTCAPGERPWLELNFKGMDIRYIPKDGTIKSIITYSRKNPDDRHVTMEKYENSILPEDLGGLETHSHVILGPLLVPNLPVSTIREISDLDLIYGNFGLFSSIEEQGLTHTDRENFLRALPYLSKIFLDLEEAKFVADAKSESEVGDFFIENGVELAVITKGSKGSVIFTEEETVEVPAYPPSEVVDTTGAGDTYVAGFVKGLELFDEVKKQGEFAAMTATMKIEKLGAFDKSTEEVLERLRQQAVSRSV